MILNSPYISGSLTVTGNIIASGSISLSGSVASASYAQNATTSSYAVASTSASYALNSTNAASASFVDYNNVANKPSLVSSSQQILDYNIFATTGSNIFVGTQVFTGSIQATGSVNVNGSIVATGQIVAQTLNVQQVTSSVVYSSGSNVFGNNISNTHQFTGSLQVTGSSHYLLGNVGINTNNPSLALNVIGQIRAGYATNAGLTIGLTPVGIPNNDLNAYVLWGDNATFGGNNGDLIYIPRTSTTGEHRFYTGNSGLATEKMRITNNGTVLMGQTLPADDGTNKLIVNGGIKGTSLSMSGGISGQSLALQQGAGASAFAQITGAGDASHGLIMRGIPASGTTSDFSVTPTDAMSFYEFGGDFRWYKKNGSLTTQMRLTGDAELLIAGATTDGTNKLIVNGGVKGNRYYATGTGFGSATSAEIILENTTATTGRTFGLNSFNSGGFQIYDVTASNATRFLIDATGAATFSSSVTAGTTLTVKGTNTTNNTETAFQYFRDGSGNELGAIIGNRGADGNAGSLRFYTNNFHTLALTLDNTSAATFSSSVTAAGISSSSGLSITGSSTFSNSTAGNLTANITNGVTSASGTTGYGLAINSEASAATSYALTVRNLASSSTYMHILTETGKVGWVGFGTTSPSTPFHVASGAATFSSSVTAVGIVSTDNSFRINGNGATPSASSLAIGTNGVGTRLLYNVPTGGEHNLTVNGTTYFYANASGIGTSGTLAVTGAATFSSLGTGTVYSNGGTLTNTNPSDLNLKNTVNNLTYGLNEVIKLQPKTFYYNDDTSKSNLKYGFIAQEVQEIMPDMVRPVGNGSEYLGLETEGIYATLVNAIKELKAENDTLKEILQRNNIN